MQSTVPFLLYPFAQTHYYIFRSGINTLYCGTFISEEPSLGNMRLIARLNKSALPNGIPAADMFGGTAIEGSDVFMVNGQTRSKFFSSVSTSATRGISIGPTER